MNFHRIAPPLRRLLCLLIVLGSVWGWRAAHANIIGFQVQPATIQAAVGRSTSARITWHIQRDGDPCDVIVRSASGVFRTDAGLVLGRVNIALSRRSVCARASVAARVTVDTFTENVLIPDAVTQRALQLGITSFFYSRAFTDGAGSSTAAVTVTLGGGTTGAFGISNVSLRFADESVIGMIDRNAALTATARIGYAGSGQIRAVWEIAGPSTASGVPQFRILSVVNRFFGIGGEITLRSPTLPSATAGRYWLRLRITRPATAFPAPELTYFVIEKRAAPPPRPIETLSPARGARLGPKTRFSWAPLADARAYRLEFYPLGPDRQTPVGRKPAGGMLVLGTHHRLLLSLPARARLRPGAYQWRIVAIGDHGRIVGASPPVPIYVP